MTSGCRAPSPRIRSFLDWLAVEFVQSHRDIKHMQKLDIRDVGDVPELRNITDEYLEERPARSSAGAGHASSAARRNGAG